MPKLSAELWAARRRAVLESAFRCFARTGFHATTIDDVIAESGLSSSVVYRYVRNKDELIAAAVDDVLTAYAAMVETLLEQEPVPPPRAAVQAIVDLLDDDRNGRTYNLAGLVIQAWAEALRHPEIGAQARAHWTRIRRRLTTLAGRWQRLGLLTGELRPADAASMLMLMTSGIAVDVTHLGGVSTKGALRWAGALERGPES